MSYLLQHTRRAMLANTANGTTGSAVGTLQVDLVSFWELEEASGTRNDSHGTNHLTDNNTVTQTTGKVGNAAEFVGGNVESLSKTSPTGLTTGAEVSFAICGWYYRKAPSATFQDLIARWDDGAVDQQSWVIQDQHDSNSMRMWITPNNSSLVNCTTAGSTLADEAWHFVYAEHDASNNRIRISINNGTFGSTNHTTGVFAGTAPLRLGASDRTTPNTNPDSRMTGLLDQWGIWIGRVLTSAEITYLYNAGAGRTYAEVLAASP